MTRARLLAVFMLVALLVLPGIASGVAVSYSTESLEDELARLANSTQALAWVHSGGVVGTEHARQVFDRLAMCSKSSKLTFIAQSFEGATVSAHQGLIVDLNQWRRNSRALITLIIEQPSAVSKCSSEIIYEAVLLALGQPTPIGILLPSRSEVAPISAYIASRITWRAVPNESTIVKEAAFIANQDPAAGIALLALYGIASHEFWDRVLSDVSTTSGLCLVFSFASTDSIPRDVAEKALAMITGPYYSLGPSAEVWLASRLYGQRGALFCFIALTRLLDAAYRDYVALLARLPAYQVAWRPEGLPAWVSTGSMDALQLLAASSVWGSRSLSDARLAALTRINGSLVYSPSALAALLTRLHPGKAVIATNWSKKSLVCRLAEAIVNNLLNATTPPSQLAWDVAASATSLCALETGDLGVVERLLLYQPFAPLDPWAVGLAVAEHTEPGTSTHSYAQRLASMLWSNNPWSALGAKPPRGDKLAETLYDLVAAGLVAWREGLRTGIPLGSSAPANASLGAPAATQEALPVNASAAETLLEQLARGGESAVASLVAANASITGAAGGASTGAGLGTSNATRILESIGLVSRTLSTRPLGNATSVLDVASIRALSSALAKQLGVINSSMEELARIATGSINATEIPRIITMHGVKTSTHEESKKVLSEITSWSLGYNPAPRPPRITGAKEEQGHTVLEKLASRIEELAKTIRASTGYGAAIKEALAEIARAIRSHDYAAATMYSQQLEKLARILPSPTPRQRSATTSPAPKPGTSTSITGPSQPGQAETTQAKSNQRGAQNAQGLLDRLAKEIQSAVTLGKPAENIGSLESLEKQLASIVNNHAEMGGKNNPLQALFPETLARGVHGVEESLSKAIHKAQSKEKPALPSPVTPSQLVSGDKLLRELQDALKNHDTRRATAILEEIARTNNEALRAKALQLLEKEDSQTVSELLKEITRQARQGGISGEEARLLRNFLGKLPLEKLGSSEAKELRLPQPTVPPPSGMAPSIHPPSIHAPSLSPPSLGAGAGSGAQWLLLAGAIGLVAVILARSLGGISIAIHRSRIRRLRRQLAEARRRGGGEAAKTLRELIIALYAEMLRLYSRLYKPKAPSETHREYAYELPEKERPVYEPVATIYEKAKFSFNPITPSDVSLVEEELESLQSRVEQGKKRARKR